MSDFYVVIEHDRHGIPEDQSISLCWNLADAVELADSLTRDNGGVRYVPYALVEVHESDLWDWGHRYTNARVLQFVHERAARNTLCDGVTLVRRRKGTDEWREVPDGQ